MQISTAYDDVFRTLVNDCAELIIPVINEVFGEHYTGEEEIRFSPNEHFINFQDGGEEKRITDTSFWIIGKECRKYHLECQSSDDDSMLVRLFEYDTQIALDEGEIKDYILTVEFPHSAVLFLRCDKNMPNQMEIRMKTPGGEVRYRIPVVKTQKYTIDEIFEKKLLFLIPFYIFSHESRFKVYNTDEEKKNELIQEYVKIRYRLEELVMQGQISGYMKCTILDMSNRVLEQIARKYDNVREGVRGTMVGKVLEYEAKTILRRGISQGKKEEALNNARNFFMNGLDYEVARKCIQSLSEEELKEVYEEVQKQACQSEKETVE